MQESTVAVFRNTSKLWELVVQGSSAAVSTKASKLWELVVQDSSVAVFRKASKIWELCLLKALLQKNTWSCSLRELQGWNLLSLASFPKTNCYICLGAEKKHYCGRIIGHLILSLKSLSWCPPAESSSCSFLLLIFCMIKRCHLPSCTSFSSFLHTYH